MTVKQNMAKVTITCAFHIVIDSKACPVNVKGMQGDELMYTVYCVFVRWESGASRGWRRS